MYFICPLLRLSRQFRWFQGLFFLDDGYSASFKFERERPKEAVAHKLTDQFD
jgi:hypothetical protein